MMKVFCSRLMSRCIKVLVFLWVVVCVAIPRTGINADPNDIFTLSEVFFSDSKSIEGAQYRNAVNLLIADINNDTISDALVNDIFGNLYLFVGNGTNESPRLSEYILIDEGVTDFFAIDVDGDTDIDIVGTDGVEDVVFWLENVSNRSVNYFLPRNIIENNANGAFDIIADDLDNDGDKDIVYVSAVENRVVWFENRINEPANDFSSQNIITTTADAVRAVITEDVDNDGFMDIIYGTFGDNTIYWQKNLNPSVSDFGTPQIISTTSGDIYALSGEDLDLDGDIDIVSSSCNASIITWIENRLSEPEGDFANAITLESDGSCSNLLVIEDIDNDGDKDIIYDSKLDELIFLENVSDSSGDVTFNSSVQIFDFGINDSTRSFFVSDLDKDNISDVVHVSNIVNTVSELPGGAEFSRGAQIYWSKNISGNSIIDYNSPIPLTMSNLLEADSFPLQMRDFTTSDFDVDGDVDIILSESDDENMIWYQNDLDISGQFLVSGYLENSNRTSHILSGDLDNDGFPDVVALSASLINSNYHISWYKNEFQSNQSFSAEIMIHSSPVRYDGINISDIDMDSDLDVIVFNRGSFGNSEIYILENQLDEITNDFAPPVLVYQSTQRIQSEKIEIVDLNGDSLPDISFRLFSQGLRWIENQSTSSQFVFGSDFFIGGTVNLFSDFGVVDFDLDGDKDFIDIFQDSNILPQINFIVIYENKISENIGIPESNFQRIITNIPIYGFGENGPDKIVIGEIDGDGKPDLVFSKSVKSNVDSVFFRNAHNNTLDYTEEFFQGQFTGFGSGGIDEIGLVDLTGNEVSDLVLLNQESDLLAWRETKTLFDTKVNGVGDINGDGFEDLIISSPRSFNDGGVFCAGEVIVLLGGNEIPDIDLDDSGSLTEFNINEVDSSNYFRIGGEQTDDNFGNSISGLGDINGDGYSDFGIGAIGGNKAYVIFGSDMLTTVAQSMSRYEIANLSSQTLDPVINGIKVIGEAGETTTSEFFGISMSGVHDFDNDGFDDFVIGASGYNDFSGRVYLIRGSEDLGTETILDIGSLNSNTGMVFTTETEFEQIGIQLSGLGDVNGDGFADLGITTRFTGSNIYIVYGTQDFSDETNPTSPINNGFFNLSALGEFATKDYGAVFATEYNNRGNLHDISGIGDFNGDGRNDMLISSRDNSFPGSVFLLFGSDSGIGSNGLLMASSLATSDGYEFQGNDLIDPSLSKYPSNISAAGDVNQDGFSDLLISAIGGETFVTNYDNELPERQQGFTAILFGTSSPLNSSANLELTDLSPSSLAILSSYISFDDFGIGSSTIGDFDGDGIQEFAISSRLEPPGVNLEDFGSLYLLDLSDDAMVVSYRNFMESTTTELGGGIFEDKDTGIIPVGSTGDGSHIIPKSRVSLGFTGGGFGPNLLERSQQTVQYIPNSIPSPDFPDGAVAVADVFWNIETFRNNFTHSQFEFYLTKDQLSGIDPEKSSVFFSPASSLSTNTWIALESNLDLESGKVLVTRIHNRGSSQSEYNGRYTVMEVDNIIEIGDKINPPITVNLDNLLEGRPKISPSGAAYWHAFKRQLYAVKNTEATITWEDNLGQIQAVQNINIRWPEDESRYQLHVAETPPVNLLPDDQFERTILLYTEAVGVDEAAVSNSGEFSAEFVPIEDEIGNLLRTNISNKSLILFSEGSDPQQSEIYFQLVQTKNWDEVLPADIPHKIGSPIIPKDELENENTIINLHEDDCGNGFVYWELAHYNAGQGYYNRSTRTGPIIPVNRDKPVFTTSNTYVEDDMLVIWYQKGSKLYNADTGFQFNSQICWPWAPRRYDCQWPQPVADYSFETNLQNPTLAEREELRAQAGDLVIASQRGFTMSKLLYSTFDIYNQPDPEFSGHNPNEEHAFVSGNVIYALRDDLGVIGTREELGLDFEDELSQPYVLVNYIHPSNGEKRMKVIGVQAESDENIIVRLPNGNTSNSTDGGPDDIAEIFKYDAEAGLKILTPAPLNLFQRCSTVPLNTYGVDDLTYNSGRYDPNPQRWFEDRKGDFWALAAGNNGGNANANLRYFYRTRDEFFMPEKYKDALRSASDPTKTQDLYDQSETFPVGSCIPWLDNWNLENAPIGMSLTLEGPGIPRNIEYEIKWPSIVPKLSLGESLVKSKSGLPNITDQPSVTIAYEQVVAAADQNSTEMLTSDQLPEMVRLIDPTTITGPKLGDRRSVDISDRQELLKNIETTNKGNRIVFDRLPESLRNRVYIDPFQSPERLVFGGEYIEVIAGEDVLLPNVMSIRERVILKSLDDLVVLEESEWDKAVQRLYDQTKLIVEIDPDHTVWDSLAISSADAEGSGFFTVIFGNLDDPRIVPAATPVSMQVIKLAPPLYRGEVKVVTPTCPFDEKFTLRHSGDFAGSSDNYYFEWQWAAPDQDGLPPSWNANTGWNDFLTPDHPEGDEEIDENNMLVGLPDILSSPSLRGSNEIIIDERAPEAIALIDTYWRARWRPRYPKPLISCGNAIPDSRFIWRPIDDPDIETDGVPLAIPDNNSLGVQAVIDLNREEFDLPLPGEFVGLQVSIDRLPGFCSEDENAPAPGILHPNIQDLEISLESPQGTRIRLVSAGVLPQVSNICGLTFSKGGAEFINSETNGPQTADDLFSSVWKPEGSFDDFDGEDPAGEWKLIIRDLGFNNEGFIRGWSLEITPQDDFEMCGDVTSDELYWSEWTRPQLAEGWIKRVVGDIGPFAQRATGGGIEGAEGRFFDYTDQNVNTIVSMIAQAGERYAGDVPLTCDNIDEFGLIEIYETVLRRGLELSIDNPSNELNSESETADALYNALLLVAGRIADLYSLLGNEAFADAIDPTIGFGTDDPQFGSIASSIHAFQNQTGSLLEEELALLRGRDDNNATGVAIQPFYNRLIWNFTNDITGGEVAYSLNYLNGDDFTGDGTVDEEDAKFLFPQAHGDAWGHYLTAMASYYRLLRNPRYQWEPRIESVLVGGTTFSVDYQDERKFAQLAAAKARTGRDIVDLTYRQYYVEDPEDQWQGYLDQDRSRQWGMSEWGARAGQGAYFDWLVGNAMLPMNTKIDSDSDMLPDWIEHRIGLNPDLEISDPMTTNTLDKNLDSDGDGRTNINEINNGFLVFNPDSDGDGIKDGLESDIEGKEVTPGSIRDIHRGTVPELDEVASILSEIQASMDNADRGLNPLGLSRNVVPFDIDPAGIDQGKTHFEQVYDRAVRALNNTITVFNFANGATQALRRQADQVADFQRNVEDREADFNNRLIEIFGYPYSDDIGGAGLYAQGYDGPDLYHYMYVDPVELFEADAEIFGSGAPRTQTFTVEFSDFDVSNNGTLNDKTQEVTYHLSTSGLGLIKPEEWTGQRRAPGEIQMARSDLLQASWRFQTALRNYDNLLKQIEDQAEQIEAQFGFNAFQLELQSRGLERTISINDRIAASRSAQIDFRKKGRQAVGVANAVAEAIPTQLPTAGFSISPGDVLSFLRSAIRLSGQAVNENMTNAADQASLDELDLQQAKEEAQALQSLQIQRAQTSLQEAQQIQQLEQLIRGEVTARLEIYTAQEAINQSQGRYQSALARGLRLLEDRNRFRRQTAAQTQEYRYKDMAFRIFRNDAIQKYRAQFDLAARYVYLAAKSYDFETNLLDEDQRVAGQEFLTDIVRTRHIGVIEQGQPLTGSGTGDPGLADPMARMFLNFDLVLKGQLGFNNPQTETNRFSLRNELFRTADQTSTSATKWREVLERSVVSNILDDSDFQRYCRPFVAENGLNENEPAIVIDFGTHINFGFNYFINLDGEDPRPFPLGGGDSSYDTTNFATKIRSVGMWFSNYNSLAGTGMSNTPRVYLVPAGQDVMRSPDSSIGTPRYFTVEDQVLPVPFPIGGGSLSDRDWVPINDSLSGTLGDIRRYGSFRAYHDSGSFNQNEVINDSRLIGRSVWNTRWILIIPAGTLHSDRNEGIRRFIYGRKLSSPSFGSIEVPLVDYRTGENLKDSDGDPIVEFRDGNGVSDIRLFFQTYAYSGGAKALEAQKAAFESGVVPKSEPLELELLTGTGD